MRLRKAKLFKKKKTDLISSDAFISREILIAFLNSSSQSSLLLLFRDGHFNDWMYIGVFSIPGHF